VSACCFSELVSQLISSGFLFPAAAADALAAVGPKRSGDSPVERVQFFWQFFLFVFNLFVF
jgi:hypothetical protein